MLDDGSCVIAGIVRGLNIVIFDWFLVFLCVLRLFSKILVFVNGFFEFGGHIGKQFESLFTLMALHSFLGSDVVEDATGSTFAYQSSIWTSWKKHPC